MIGLLFLQVTMQTLAPGIANSVPPTHFSCDMTGGDGTRFTVAGTTPLFPKGWDPNSAKYVTIESSHPDAFRGKVGIDPGDVGDWFREFQVSAVTKEDVRHTMRLFLRREGTSVAITTRYHPTGNQVPFEYYAAGLCKADFTPVAGGQEATR